MDELIFKKQALNAINKCREDYNISEQEQIDDCENAVRELQPVTERTGHWIDIDAETYTWKVRCDKCGNERSMMSTQGRYPKFCEECGSKMEAKHD